MISEQTKSKARKYVEALEEKDPGFKAYMRNIVGERWTRYVTELSEMVEAGQLSSTAAKTVYREFLNNPWHVMYLEGIL